LDVGIDGEPASGSDSLTITIKAGESFGIVKATEVNRDNDGSSEDRYIDNDSLSASISFVNEENAGQVGSLENLTFDDTPAITKIIDDSDPVNVTITADATTPKVIDITTDVSGTNGVKVTAIGTDGEERDLSIVSGTNHDGFGVTSTNLSNGATTELGLDEKIVVDFDNDVNSLDVAFAWRNNHETAEVTFYDDGNVVGSATVAGDGSSTTQAFVTYYDASGTQIKMVNAVGSSDKVDNPYTFELPNSTDTDIVSFDKVEFSAPNYVDDYLINKIVYTEVVDSTITDIVTSDGSITFSIQMDEDYPPQGNATVKVQIGNGNYDVALNATGRGTVTLDATQIAALEDLSSIEVKVTEVIGGGYEKVNTTSETFNFAPDPLISTNDVIHTDEDTSYILTVNDFGDYTATTTTEFKITELPTDGTLYLNVTSGDIIINKDGESTIITATSKVAIGAGTVISLANIAAGKLVFEPTANSDEDGSFKFEVGNGTYFGDEYTITIDAKAVADVPTASIDVTKVDSTESAVNLGNLNGYTEHNFGNLSSNQNIDVGNGKDHVIIGNTAGGTNIKGGNGPDVIQINGNIGGNTSLDGGNGKDILVLGKSESSYTINNYTNNNGVIAAQIIDKDTNQRLTVNNIEEIRYSNSIEEYNVDISAALADNDGSEILSVEISGAPDNASFDLNNLVDQGNGIWQLTTAEDVKSIDYTNIKMTVPEGTENVDLTITASATETRDNEDEDNVAIAIDSDTTVSSNTVSSETSLNKSTNDISSDNSKVQESSNNEINSSYNYGENKEVINGTEGSDTINIGEGNNKIINAGSGDDTINTPDSFWKGIGQVINGEDGNDTLVINHDQDDGTTRFDIVENDDGSYTIKALTYNEWDEWAAGYELTVNSVENIQFNDGIVFLTSTATKTATLIDGIVEGVEYETSSGLKGLTDSNGDFS